MRQLRAITAPVLVLFVLASIATPVLADTWSVNDLDDTVSGVQTTATLTATPGEVLTTPVHFTLTCDGNKHVNNGQSVSIEQQGAAKLDGADVASTVMSASSTSIGAIPSSWPDDAGGSGTNCGSPAESMETVTPSTVTIHAPEELGAHTATVMYKADANDGPAIGGTRTINYTLHVVPEAPETLDAEATGPTSIDVEWSRSAQHDEITSYELYRKAGSGSYVLLESLDPLIATGTTQAHEDAGLTTGTTYCYKVLARYTDANDEDFDSAFSPEDCAAPVAGFTGLFKQPIDAAVNGIQVINKAKQKGVIPVKLEVFNGTTEVENGATPLIVPSGVNCATTGSIADPVETYTAGGSNTDNLFRWSTDGGHWIYNMDMAKLPGSAANQCYRVDAFLDGSSIGYFLIQLTK